MTEAPQLLRAEAVLILDIGSARLRACIRGGFGHCDWTCHSNARPSGSRSYSPHPCAMCSSAAAWAAARVTNRDGQRLLFAARSNPAGGVAERLVVTVDVKPANTTHFEPTVGATYAGVVGTSLLYRRRHLSLLGRLFSAASRRASSASPTSSKPPL